MYKSGLEIVAFYYGVCNIFLYIMVLLEPDETILNKDVRIARCLKSWPDLSRVVSLG